MKWYVYIIECENGIFYTGLTDDINRRFNEHITGRGGVYTERNRAHTLLYHETFDNRVAAEHREDQIKRWTKKKKLALIRGNFEQLRSLSVSRD